MVAKLIWRMLTISKWRMNLSPNCSMPFRCHVPTTDRVVSWDSYAKHPVDGGFGVWKVPVFLGAKNMCLELEQRCDTQVHSFFLWVGSPKNWMCYFYCLFENLFVCWFDLIFPQVICKRHERVDEWPQWVVNCEWFLCCCVLDHLGWPSSSCSTV